MFPERRVRHFRNRQKQTLGIPRGFELPGEDAIVRKVGERLIVEAAPKKSLLKFLAPFVVTG
jgi:antitoxin VapB